MNISTIQELDYAEIAIQVACGAVLLAGLLLVSEMFFLSRYEQFTATVFELSYSPSSSSIGVGTVNTQDGPQSITVIESKSAEYKAVIVADGKVLEAKTAPEIYVTLQREDRVRCENQVGMITGIRYSTRIVGK